MSRSLSEMTDDELNAMESHLAAQSAPKQTSLKHLSDDELNTLEEKVASASTGGVSEKSYEKPSVGQSLLIGAGKGLTFGARPAIAGAAGGLAGFVESLKQGKGFGQAWDQAKDFYGQARNEAIEEQKVSAETNPRADLIGNIGGGLLTAPFIAAKGAQGATALARVGSAAKEGAKLGLATGAGTAAGEAKDLKDAALIAGVNTALGGVAGGAFQGVAEGVKKGLETKAGQAIANAGKKVLSAPAHVVKKLASSFTGISESDISTYAAQTDKIEKIIKESGGDFAGEADKLREGVQNSIRAKRQALSNQITKALDELPGDVQLNGIPVLQKLREVASKVDPDLNPESIQAIEALISKVRKKGDNGLMLPADLFKVKEFLQDMAAPSYFKDGQIFQNAKEVQIAAKQAAALARKELNNFLGEGSAIPQANKILAELHVLEKRLQKNLIKPGGPDSALFAAVRGNKRNENMLKKLGELTGKDIVGQVKELSAAKTFADAGPMSSLNTGKSLLGTVAGGAVGGVFGNDNKDTSLGAGIGLALSSPYALKKAIQAGNIPRKIIMLATGQKGMSNAALKRTAEFLKSSDGQAALVNTSGAIERRIRKAGN